MKPALTHGSLFSGIGGFELGAQMAGIETLWNCEFELHNREILKKHFPLSLQFDDVRTLSHPPYADIISGGFPCQDLSVASSRNNTGLQGERSGLWSEMYRIVDEVRPAYVVIENSDELLQKGFEKVLYQLSESGYDAEWQCFYNSDFGFNHLRERVYVIAYSQQIGRENNTEDCGIFKKVQWQQSPRQDLVSVPAQRFYGHSDYESVRMDDGFSSELDRQRIEQCGNAVNPTIAHYLFECIKSHHYQFSL